jgi:hypothetical protein
MKIIKKNMIQRIQSIYLAVAFIAMILLSFRTPIYTLNDKLIMAQDDTKMLILTLASGLLALIGLFIYRNRTLQMKFIRVAVIINVVIGVRLFVVWKAFQVSLNTSCLLILFLSTFALILAYRGVKKDDDLVRSVDRIR